MHKDGSSCGIRKSRRVAVGAFAGKRDIFSAKQSVVSPRSLSGRYNTICSFDRVADRFDILRCAVWMSLSPRKPALVGGLATIDAWSPPRLSLDQADPAMYQKLTAQWQKPPCGPNWITYIETGVMGLLPSAEKGTNYTIAVATRAPLLVSACGRKYAAHAGRHGTCGSKGSWRHTRNKFSVPYFAMISQVEVLRIYVAVFTTARAACQQYMHTLSCTQVAVYQVDVGNTAFVAIGVVNSVGFFVLGHPHRFDTLQGARQFLGGKLPLRTCQQCFDKNGAIVQGVDTFDCQSLTVQKTVPRKTECKEWCAVWNPQNQKWLQKLTPPVQVDTVDVNVNRGVVSVNVTLLCTEAPAKTAPAVFAQEFPDYAFDDARLCTSHSATTLYGRQTVKWDDAHRTYSVLVNFIMSYKMAVRLHSSATFPYFTCTIIFENYGPRKMRAALGGLCIGRYAHTDILHGVHLRAVPLSSRFFLVESHKCGIEAPKSELARILLSHTWIPQFSDGRERLLSLVRAEECPSTFVPVGKVYPGEASVMLQALRALMVQSSIFFRRKETVEMYPAVSSILPLTTKEREVLKDLPPPDVLHSFLCVTLPADLKL